jgi:hypothetical protein
LSHLGLSSGLFPLEFPTKISYAFLISPMLPDLIILNLLD